MDKVNSKAQVEQYSIQEIGKITNLMVKEKKDLVMAILMKDNT